MILQFKTSGSGDENGLGSKLYPSNILGMHSNGIIRFVQSLSRVRQNGAKTSVEKQVQFSRCKYLHKNGSSSKRLDGSLQHFCLTTKNHTSKPESLFSVVTIQLLTSSNLPV